MTQEPAKHQLPVATPGKPVTLHARRVPEQRCQGDRRTGRPTLRTVFRLRGQRKGARRAGEGHNTYVDHPHRHVVFMVWVITACSILDALFTLLYIERGGNEANPLMALALSLGVTTFVGLKMGLTGIGTVLLALHQNFRLGLRGLYSIVLIYLFLLAYHGFLWLGER
jgi:Domain of unknown function (DUF5658)